MRNSVFPLLLVNSIHVEIDESFSSPHLLVPLQLISVELHRSFLVGYISFTYVVFWDVYNFHIWVASTPRIPCIFKLPRLRNTGLYGMLVQQSSRQLYMELGAR